jgi:hypothetical protein
LGDNWDLGDPVGNWGHSVDPCPETANKTCISNNYKTLLLMMDKHFKEILNRKNLA